MLSRHTSKNSDRPARVQLTPAQARSLSPKTAPQPSGRAAKSNGRKAKINDRFRQLADRSASVVGSPWAFGAGLAIILVWALMGPIFHYSDTWQLVINTGTTIITFLMVFLIQSTQNRDAKVIQLKLDELLRGVKGARNTLIDLEKLSDEELEQLQKEFEHFRCREERKPSPPAEE